MKFLKVWKTFRGGQHEGWVIVPEWAKDPEDIKWLAKNWAENSIGGYNHGYTVHWEFGVPTMDWLKGELGSAMEIVDSKQSYVNLVEEAIDKVQG
ncbi:MAG: hypothetical protein GQ553_03990 [Nitrosomonadaceae bacterium]|nr:hypothetical protein [Nitrosomonadaceae bacterium]